MRRAAMGVMALLAAAACGSSGNGASGGNGSGNGGDGGAGGNGGGGTTTACAAATTIPLDVVDAAGAIVPDNYRRLASSYGAEEGLRYRFGEDGTCYGATATSPALYQPIDQFCLRSGNYGSGLLYQVGPPACTTDVGDYSSTQGVALYMPDVATGGGVDVLQTISEGFGVFESKPQVSWTFGTAVPSQLGDASWITTNGGPVQTPIAAARSYRDPNGEQNVNALVAFQSGLLGAFGENTGNNGFKTKLPHGLVPTSLALTNGNELALVTVWDPSDLSGKLVVLAMTTCEESTMPMCLPNGSLLSTYAIQHQPYPGFVNDANYTGAKLLGVLPLPIHAPTAISATTNYALGWWTKGGSNTNASQFDFSNETDRQTFVAGENRAKYSSAGFAVVVSQSEKKAVFVDLAPIFAFYKKMYFGDRASFDATRALGPGAHEWPYTFADTPEQLPTIAASIDLDDRPTAVVTTRSKRKPTDDGYGALVAMRGGRLVSYDVGGLVDGSGAGDVRAIGSVDVGRNPTHVTYRKAHVWSGNDPFSGATTSVTRDEVIVVSRGDREIDFVRMDAKGATGSVYKRLKDATLVDPVAAEDNDTHGTESYVLTVADFGGRQIVSYRFGPVILHTNGGASFGMGSDGKADFELGGTFAVAGRPFQFSSANVP